MTWWQTTHETDHPRRSATLDRTTPAEPRDCPATLEDVRPGGYQRWTEVSANEPDLRIHIYVNLTDVTDGELLEGVMHVAGQLQEGIEPFATRFRVEFHDEGEGRTRLEIRQWLPPHLAGPSEQGWLEAFTKLDATLTSAQIAADREGVVA